jgi:nitroreductase
MPWYYPIVSFLLLLLSWRQAGAFSATSMQFQELLLSRRTINSFEPQLPNYWEQYLGQAIEAATFAPNHKLTEPWRFHLLGKQTIERVSKLNAELVADKKGEQAGAKKLQRWMAMPGWLVVTQVVATGEDDRGAGDFGNDPMSLTREDYAACCCAVQNLCLSLHANGLGTKWTTGPVNFDPRFSEAVGLSDNERVVGTIWFGKPAMTPSPPKKKKSLNDVLVRHD